jgi:hypothetical protein
MNARSIVKRWCLVPIVSSPLIQGSQSRANEDKSRTFDALDCTG